MCEQRAKLLFVAFILMKDHLAFFLLVAGEFALERVFSDFRKTFLFHFLLVYLLLARGLLPSQPKHFLVKCARWLPDKLLSSQPEHQTHAESDAISPRKGRVREEHRPTFYDTMSTVVSVKITFFLIPLSMRWVISILLLSLRISFVLLGIVLRFFDSAPIWLLLVIGVPMLRFLSVAAVRYLKWWVTAAVWLIGGYAVLVFAVVSALYGLSVGSWAKRHISKSF